MTTHEHTHSVYENFLQRLVCRPYAAEIGTNLLPTQPSSMLFISFTIEIHNVHQETLLLEGRVLDLACLTHCPSKYLLQHSRQITIRMQHHVLHEALKLDTNEWAFTCFSFSFMTRGTSQPLLADEDQYQLHHRFGQS